MHVSRTSGEVETAQDGHLPARVEWSQFRQAHACNAQNFLEVSFIAFIYETFIA
jgi:hypothetical protein